MKSDFTVRFFFFTSLVTHCRDAQTYPHVHVEQKQMFTELDVIEGSETGFFLELCVLAARLQLFF